MGYNITIGELTVEYDQTDRCLRFSAEGHSEEDAPDFPPDPTGKGNSRSPSYSTWQEFLLKYDLAELFYWKDESSGRAQYRPWGGHPGAVPIGPAERDLVTNKLYAYLKEHPDAKPGFWDWDDQNFKEIDNGKDPNLARLIWLQYWVSWAVNNCKRPVIANS